MSNASVRVTKPRVVLSGLQLLVPVLKEATQTELSFSGMQHGYLKYVQLIRYGIYNTYPTLHLTTAAHSCTSWALRSLSRSFRL
jgi:hypothetical protein